MPKVEEIRNMAVDFEERTRRFFLEGYPRGLLTPGVRIVQRMRDAEKKGPGSILEHFRSRGDVVGELSISGEVRRSCIYVRYQMQGFGEKIEVCDAFDFNPEGKVVTITTNLDLDRPKVAALVA